MRKNKRDDIIAATIHLVAQKGVSGSTVRQIAGEAGVTEGALYRHFASKEDLCQQVYGQIVAEMASVKEEILASQVPVRDKFYEWVRVSYEDLDRYPDAFTYVLLTDHNFLEDLGDITTRQGRLLMKMLEPLTGPGQPVTLGVEVAFSHFIGVMLNIPRLINESILVPPASRYTDEAVQALWRIFQIDD